MAKDAREIITRCGELRRYWIPRNEKFKEWYRLLEMIDELKTEKMESFVGNDPRSMYNLVLHLLDTKIPHRVKGVDSLDYEYMDTVAAIAKMLKLAWKDIESNFRKGNPQQSMSRHRIGMMLATGWYAEAAMVFDDGSKCYSESWNPAEVFPMWADGMLSEVAHIYSVSASDLKGLARRNGWKLDRYPHKNAIYDYWWVEFDNFMYPIVWNAIIVGSAMVKNEPTRFKRIPVYVGAVGGLPDTGPITEGSPTTAQAQVKTDRWKGEIGQPLLATNEHIFRTWNKWWTYSLQLLRDTAQPRIFERSRSGKPIVKPEDVFRRGAIFRGGPDDSVEFIGAPPIPLEIRSTQLDLEAMMQRGGVSWALYGNIQGALSAYVMSQIAASANQVIKPFHQANINLLTDIDTDLVEDVMDRGISPYGVKIPKRLPEDAEISAEYDIEIPGDLVQKATVARMLDPEFRVSRNYVMQKLFPDIADQIKEKAMVRSDMAERHPMNTMIDLIMFYRRQARYLETRNPEAAKLYEMAAEAAERMLAPPQPSPALPAEGEGRTPGIRPEVVPPPTEATQTPV